MARQRFIWPEIWSDPSFGRLKADEKVLYIGCFSNADDEGRLHADPAFLRSAIFPYQEFTLAKMRKLRDTLVEKMPSVRLYTVKNSDYIELTNWSEWQRPQYPKPSKLPSPDDAVAEHAAQSLAEASRKPSGTVDEASIVGWVGLGRDGMGRAGVEDAPGDPSERTAALRELRNCVEQDVETQSFLEAFAFKLPAAAFYDAKSELEKRARQRPALRHKGKYVSEILGRMVEENVYAAKEAS